MGNLPYCQDLKFSNKLEYGVGRYWEISYGIFIKMVLDKKKKKLEGGIEKFILITLN